MRSFKFYADYVAFHQLNLWPEEIDFRGIHSIISYNMYSLYSLNRLMPILRSLVLTKHTLINPDIKPINLFYRMESDVWVPINYQLYIGFCKVEKEILKKAKNLEKWQKWSFWDPKRSFWAFLATFKISLSSLQHPSYIGDIRGWRNKDKTRYEKCPIFFHFRYWKLKEFLKVVLNIENLKIA